MKKTNKKEVPPFKNYQEEAAFWDSHDPLDYIEPGTKPLVFKGQLQGSLNIRFTDEDLKELRIVAIKKGLGPTTLVRMWTKEKLQEERMSQHNITT